MWSTLWVAWALAFGVIEGLAIKADKTGPVHATLSEHLRLWFRTDTHIGRTAWLIISGLFFGWFVVHIAVAGAA